ncbi:MAG: 6-bladed beta-propeller [Bacteroidales bacterium]
MTRHLLFCLSLCLLVSCDSRKSSSLSDTSLTVIDLSGDFPLRRIDLHDIFDVEYIPLETNEKSLLTNTCSTYFVSNDYIITADLIGGNIFFFNRSGKHLRTLNRRGDGGEEYSRCPLTVDFEAEECFVYDYFKKKNLVYDFQGVYKRTLAGPPQKSNFNFSNYDKNFLFGFNNLFDNVTQSYPDEHPYYLVSKIDGSMQPIDLSVKKRMGSVVHSELVRYGNDSSIERTYFFITPLLENASDLLVADFALDTLYSFNDRKLTPIAVRTPSVRATDPPVILSPFIYTDSLFCFEMMPYYYNPANPTEAYDKSRDLICDRRTGKIEEIEFYNSDFSTKSRNMRMGSIKSIVKNYCISWYSSERLIDQYNAGLLKGKLKEVASKLLIEDNDVLILCKFK